MQGSRVETVKPLVRLPCTRALRQLGRMSPGDVT